ncbi:hypothetical protein C3L33_09898, partial [Rhododendron williamsianum]
MAVPSSTSKQVGFSKSCINNINALSGVGILSAPYALSSGGWLSLILLLLIVASAYFTGLLICRCMDSNPSITTYPDIAATAFGRKGRITASIIIYSELYLVAVGFLIIEGDNLHKLFPNFALKLGNLTMDGRNSFAIVAGALIFPSILLTDLGVLSYISFGGVISSIIIVAAVLCVGTTKGVGFHEKGNLVNFKGLPTALSLYTFSYGGHAMFPAIYNSMKKKSQFPKVCLKCLLIMWFCF